MIRAIIMFVVVCASTALGASWLQSGQVGEAYLPTMPGGLLMHLPMNDNAASTNVTNSSFGAQCFSYNTTAGMHVDGKVGSGAFHFGGTNDYVDLTGFYDYGIRTVCLWFSSDTELEGPTFVHHVDPAGQNTWGTFPSTVGKIGFIWAGAYYPGPNPEWVAYAFNSSWIHLSFIASNQTMLLYTNAVKVWSVDYGSGAVTSAAIRITTFGETRIALGAISNLVGNVDDLRIYTNALTDSELSVIYNGGGGTER